MTYTRVMKPMVAFDVKAADEVSLARRMAREGATAAEIAKALGWNRDATLYRLKKVNIKLHSRRRREDGADTHFPHEDSINMSAYRPRMLTPKRKRAVELESVGGKGRGR